jgi:ribosomal protein L25 (general stress protein Ctc)
MMFPQKRRHNGWFPAVSFGYFFSLGSRTSRRCRSRRKSRGSCYPTWATDTWPISIKHGDLIKFIKHGDGDSFLLNMGI